MKLRVNGDPLEVEQDMTIGALVAQLGLDKGPVAVERNGVVVPRAKHGDTKLSEGDVVEIVHFVGGGS